MYFQLRSKLSPAPWRAPEYESQKKLFHSKTGGPTFAALKQSLASGCPQWGEYNSQELPREGILERGIWMNQPEIVINFAPAARFYGYISSVETFLLKWQQVSERDQSIKSTQERLKGEPFTGFLGASWMEIKSIQFGFLLVFRVCNFLRILKSLIEPGLVNNSNWWPWSDSFA